MLSLIFTYFLHSQSQLFTGNCPTAPLQGVLTIARKIKPSQKPVTTKKEINDYLQTHWLRKPGTERNTIAPQAFTVSQRRALRAALCTLRMITAQKPKYLNPKVVVILGGNYLGMEERIGVAKTFVESLKGIKPPVILLTGDRNLETTRTDGLPPLDEGAPADCTTEEAAGEYLAKTSLDFSMTVVNSPTQNNAERATTADNATTLKAWLVKQGIQKGQIVLVSTQPYAQYQLATFLKHFPDDKNYYFSVLAAPIHGHLDDTVAAKCMDTLARWVYTETRA